VDCRVVASGLTPYLVAEKYGNTECAELLIGAGCNRNACDSRGRDASLLRECFAKEG
jgi:ankyrin repeat protein